MRRGSSSTRPVTDQPTITEIIAHVGIGGTWRAPLAGWKPRQDRDLVVQAQAEPCLHVCLTHCGDLRRRQIAVSKDYYCRCHLSRDACRYRVENIGFVGLPWSRDGSDVVWDGRAADVVSAGLRLGWGRRG
jgi:hypothetical protein